MYAGIVLGVISTVIALIAIAILILVVRHRKHKNLTAEIERKQQKRLEEMMMINRPPRRPGVGQIAGGIIQVKQTAVQVPVIDPTINESEDEDERPLSPSASEKGKSGGIIGGIMKKISRQSGSSDGLNKVPRKWSKTKKSSYSITSPESYPSAQEAVHSTNNPTHKTSTGSNWDFNGNHNPEIILSILYNDMAASLTLTVLCIRNLSEKLDEHNVYVQAVLRPKHHQKQRTRDVIARDPEFNECFFFDKIMILDLPTSHLMVTLNKSSNHKQIAELFIDLAAINLEYGLTSHFKFPLITKPRSRRKSTLEKLLQVELGQIMILLHYQAIRNRLKVQVNKASQLPRTESTIFKSDYQVVIELYNRNTHQMLSSKHSGVQTGENPIWNESFLFDLTTNQLDDHYLDFTVVEKSRCKPYDDVIGHVLLGSDNTSSQAISQWKESSQPCRLEEAQWHTILPVIKYNVETME